jgi:hypothetical protein
LGPYHGRLPESGKEEMPKARLNHEYDLLIDLRGHQYDPEEKVDCSRTSGGDPVIIRH